MKLGLLSFAPNLPSQVHFLSPSSSLPGARAVSTLNYWMLLRSVIHVWASDTQHTLPLPAVPLHLALHVAIALTFQVWKSAVSTMKPSCMPQLQLISHSILYDPMNLCYNNRLVHVLYSFPEHEPPEACNHMRSWSMVEAQYVTTDQIKNYLRTMLRKCLHHYILTLPIHLYIGINITYVLGLMW